MIDDYKTLLILPNKKDVPCVRRFKAFDIFHQQIVRRVRYSVGQNKIVSNFDCSTETFN